MDLQGLISVQRLKLSPDAAAYFGKSGKAFTSLIDAIATGDYKGTVEACKAAGVSEKHASLVMRDSAALASAVLAIGSADCW